MRFPQGTVKVRSRYFIRGASYSIQQQDVGCTFNLPRPHGFASVVLLASTISECVQFKKSSAERAATTWRLVFITFKVRLQYCRSTAEVHSRYG